MRLIKNFLHNINDIVLAIVIVALAAGIIYWRMQIILDYPEKLVNQQSVQTEEQADAAEEQEAAAEEQTDAEQPAEQTGTEEEPQG